MVKKISKNNLPDGEVLAFNGSGTLIGYLDRDHDGTATCSAELQKLRRCTHYIPSSEVIKIFKDSKE